MPPTPTRSALGRAAALIGEREEVWLDALGRLLAVDTSFPPGDGYVAFAEVLEALLVPRGFACQRVEVPEALWAAPGSRGARVNLVAAPVRRRGRACGIYVHTDTVPAGEGWTRPPFALTREGELLFGRGTVDMKGAIAALIAAVDAAAAAGLPLARDPVLLACTDEEGGLYPGVRYLAEQGLLGCNELICLNGGAVPRIWAGCFGSLDIAITVEGRAAHSGDPGPEGVNAIEAAMPVLEALMALKGVVEQRISAMPAAPARGRPLSARLTIAAMHGGAKGSALPGRCAILVNRRVMPEETMAGALAEIEAAVEAARRHSRALGVSTQVVGRLDPVTNPDSGAAWPHWQQALAWGFGWRAADFTRYGSSTSSDMGFVQQAGLSEIMLGGLVRPQSRGHGPDEFTTVADIASLARALLAYLADLPIPTGDTP